MKKLKLILNAAFINLIVMPVTFASSSGSNLPWEKGLGTIRESITGPVAYTIIILAIVGSGAGMIFSSSELSSGLKLAIKICFFGAIVTGAASLASTLFGVSGALV